MKIAFYDPIPVGNEYCTIMFLHPLLECAKDRGHQVAECNPDTVRDSHVVLLTDHLTEERIYRLKENGNKIIGINVTDSSYISGAIRYAKSLPLVDLIFMVSGVQAANEDFDLVLTDDFQLEQKFKPFLDPENWTVFDRMVKAEKLKSLPYVPWQRINPPPWTPWGQRSQKTILRGGGHSRRFMLALFLMLKDRLDPNSGFVLRPYFDDAMNPQFRFCDACRRTLREEGVANYHPENLQFCNSPAHGSFDSNAEFAVADLGQWNNRCPNSFYWFAQEFAKRHGPVDMEIVKKMLNARWLHPDEHMAMLGRILFTSDLKWIHSIYQPQRYWEAAAAGCINVLPERAIMQIYFPETKPHEHYLVYGEKMRQLELEFRIDEGPYREMAAANRNLFDRWIQPTSYRTNTNLLEHMLGLMDRA